MEIFLLLIQVPILILLLKYIRTLHSDALFVKSYYFILSFKVTAGLILGILYFNYYKEGDTLIYSQDINFLSGYFEKDFNGYIQYLFLNKLNPELASTLHFLREPRAFLFVKILSPIFIFTGSNYWILSIYLTLFAFTGFWVLSNTLLKLFNLNSFALLLSFFIFPSVVFWSSGVIKESLAIGMLGFCLTISFQAIHQQNYSWIRVIVLLIFSYFLVQLKFYYFAALISVLVPYAIIQLLKKRITLLEPLKYQLLFLFLFIIAMAYTSSFLHPLLNANILFESVYRNYITTIKQSEGLNMIIFEGLNASPLSFVKHIPQALSYGLFGPFLWNCKKVIALLSGIENTIILILFVTFILQIFRKDINKKASLLAICLILYVSVLAIFMTFSSPNWGTLVRYKIGYLPFFLILLLNNNPYVLRLDKNFNPKNLDVKKS